MSLSGLSLHRVVTGLLTAGFVVVGYQLLYEITATGAKRQTKIPTVVSYDNLTHMITAELFNTNPEGPEIIDQPDAWKPFNPHEPHLLLILSYQRCGSSFFGGLFGNDPKGLYFYEPLDGLYGAMYGTPEGWNVPSDIMNWKDGSQRQIPEAELDAVAGYIEDILTCNYPFMPNEFVLHRFWAQFKVYQPQLAEYARCLGNADKINAHGLCHKFISRSCSSRFGKDLKKQARCMRAMWNTTANKPRYPVEKYQRFPEYSRCMDENRQSVNHCVSRLTTLCQKSEIRSVKTVRATMDSVERLLKKHSNLRVIHLIRDPRAVVLSRSKFHSSGKSMYAGKDMVAEAKLFCQNLVRDITLRHTLELKYPGLFMEVVYDDFVQAPLNYTHQIYTFMNMTLSNKVLDWVVKNTQERRNSSSIASKWMSTLTKSQVQKISGVCDEFFKLVPRDWIF